MTTDRAPKEAKDNNTHQRDTQINDEAFQEEIPASLQLDPVNILYLQRTIGNQAVQRLLNEKRTHNAQEDAASVLHSPPGNTVVHPTPGQSIVQRHGDHTDLTQRQRYEHTIWHAYRETESTVSKSTATGQWEAGYIPDAKFMGIAISKGIHQELRDRLDIAESYLRDQFTGESDEDIARMIGLYSVSGRRAPKNAVGGSRITSHAFGLAIDVNYQGNPYVARKPDTDKIIARATQLILGTEIHIGGRQEGALQEIRARYESASLALQDYFALRDDLDGIRRLLASRGLSADDQSVQQWNRKIKQDYNNSDLKDDFATNDPGKPRDPAAGFIDLSEKLVEALGNQARLYWGGQYKTGKDIMHFDWREGTIKEDHRT